MTKMFSNFVVVVVGWCLLLSVSQVKSESESECPQLPSPYNQYTTCSPLPFSIQLNDPQEAYVSLCTALLSFNTSSSMLYIYAKNINQEKIVLVKYHLKTEENTWEFIDEKSHISCANENYINSPPVEDSCGVTPRIPTGKWCEGRLWNTGTFTSYNIEGTGEYTDDYFEDPTGKCFAYILPSNGKFPSVSEISC